MKRQTGIENYSTAMNKRRRQTDEDLTKISDTSQEETPKHVKDEDLTKTSETSQEETPKHVKAEEYKTDPGVNKQESKTHAKGQVVYDSYQNKRDKAILNENRKRLKELSEKHENQKRGIRYLQERTENPPMVMDKADINYKYKNGESLLHAACLQGGLKMVKFVQSTNPLLVRQFDSKGRSVCHSAAAGGSVDVLNFLVQEGADPLCTDVDGLNILQYACLEGNKEMAFHLMDNYSVMLYNVGKGVYTVSHCAAYGGSIAIFKRVFKLMNVSCRADSSKCYDETESHHEKHASLRVRTKAGETLLHMACLNGKLEMTQYLIAKYPDMVNEVNQHKASLAHYAAEGGNISVLQYLIDHGLDPWCRTDTQQTLLHMSCISGQLEITEYLLEKYTDMINEVDNEKRTPAHYAAYIGDVSVVQPMTDQVVDLSCGSAAQQILTYSSCTKSHLKIITYMIKKNPYVINGVDSCNETPAHYAAKTGTIPVLQYLIDKGLNPWCRTDTQETLLHKACIAGQLEMTQYLLEKYPDMIKEVDNCERTPGHYAAQSRNIRVLQYLIDQGLDPWCRTTSQETLLHLSCIAGRLEMTQYLVEKYSDMIKEVDKRNESPGHYAVQNSNVDVLQYLIVQGLDPWCRTKIQETLFHVSSISGQLEMSKYLVEKYPDMINHVDSYHETPGHYAAYGGNISVLQCLIDQGLDPSCISVHQQTLLHQSCFAGQLAMSKYLIENYPEMINEVDSSNETPAHSAAYGGNVSILQYLIDQGLNPWSESVQRQTLLHHSCVSGQLEMSKYLIEKYPDMIYQVDNDKETSAHYASQSDNVSVLQYLIDKGLDPLCRTATQETLLHMACFAGQLEMTQYLVEKYPDMIYQVDKYKHTPTHCASHSGNVSVLKYLIDKGLDPQCKTATQETLLHNACFAGQLEMTQYLVEQYPDMIYQVDNEKGTSAHDATLSGNVCVLQYLIDKGLDPLCRTATQETFLHKAAKSGQLEMTQYLVEKYPEMICQFDNYKHTPAHCAAQSGNVSVLKYLIDKGLNPQCKTATQETLLHKACFAGQLEMTQYLAEKYPDMIYQVFNYKHTPTHCAAHSGNVSVLQYLTDKGLDPWCRTARQETLLHKACIAGHLEMTQYLVKKYPDMIYHVGNDKDTPAHCAAQSGNVSVLKYLIDKGLDPRSRTATQETLLHMACFAGQLEMTQYLVEKYPDMIYQVDKYKHTPTHCASHSGNASVSKYLIDKGLDPQCKTATQETLLHNACFAGQLEMTQYLVEQYPDMIYQVDNEKGTSAHDAALSGNVCVLQYLLDKGLDPLCRTATQETLLHKAAKSGQLEMTQYLVEKYPEMICQFDNYKHTPAHCAAQSGNVSVLKYLIDKGLNPQCKTATQETLLHKACFAGQLEMTQYLAEKYPDMIYQVFNYKHTPTHCAAHSGNVSVLQYLTDKGLDPWCRTARQETLLHKACIAGHLEMTQYLVKKYPDMIYHVGNDKDTPAHCAAQSGNVSVLKYLIDKGLDPRSRTATQETLLHMACFAGQLEMTQYLVEKYPDMIYQVDKYKHTPTHCASHSGNVSVSKYLIDKGLDPQCKTATQETLLHNACFAGQLEMTQYLVEQYPDMIYQVDNEKGTSAHDAALSGNVCVLQYLLDKGLDPLCRTATQETLLHKAAKSGQLEMTQYLVEKYPEMICQFDNYKHTPAHCAAQSGNVSVLKYLIDKGLNPQCKTATQETLLHKACFAGQLEMTQYLVEKYPDMIYHVGNNKDTPGHCAAQSGNVSVLKYLIDKGLDPRCRTATQETLLYRACIAGQLEMTQYLVEKYPDMIYQVYNYKHTPTHCAAHSGNVSVLQYLTDKGLDPRCRTATQETLLHKACFASHLEMTQYLVEKYPDMIYQVDTYKRTPAHDAAFSGNVCVLQYLIDKGLDPLCRTATQETLLYRACIAGQLEMTQYLVEKYPDMIYQVDNDKVSPTHCASHSGNVSVLQYLIDKGLDPRSRTATQETLLHKACFAGQLEMTQCLVEQYPDMIYQVDNYKHTPAHDAALSGNVYVLQYLIDKGLNPRCRTATQETLLHKAVKSGQLEMTQYLVEKYPEMICQFDNHNHTPAHFAFRNGNDSVLQYLINKGQKP
ncbi:hypothetical protein CHS0354_020954 [Potamilus streckersoni]|uniref:Uncharacterized protein n=1 Tax=Potamilus streckersoni TaxID=2493646 RepID=A0AAE0VSF2_9BIVA|nr:hypothetical protein CHS0354_020954 [Potamilus streckersoni]